ncbi:hypothetical protein RF11_13917 [Thelohanellus kitauei]|uniref:Uncharacterized protein n=1 Tax=Thelohanellus kitauei TaxID=669202 RepID=A0A0C2M9E2_THEKT|nr:hypothetical protein RF11_13917 [Thelohanellus kitauei]
MDLLYDIPLSQITEGLRQFDSSAPQHWRSYCSKRPIINQKISDERLERIIKVEYYKKYSETGRMSKENVVDVPNLIVNEEIKTFIRELVDENCGNDNKQLSWTNALYFKNIHVIPIRRNDPDAIHIQNDFALLFLRSEENYPDE